MSGPSVVVYQGALWESVTGTRAQNAQGVAEYRIRDTGGTDRIQLDAENVRFGVGAIGVAATGLFDNLASTDDILNCRDNGTERFVVNDGGLVEIDQYLRIGSATDAAAEGDFVAGLTGAGRVWYDASERAFRFFDSAGAEIGRLGQLGGTAGYVGFYGGTDSAINDYIVAGNGTDHLINAASGGTLELRIANTTHVSLTATAFVINETGAASDTRIEGDNKTSNLLLDASDDEVAIDGRFSLVALTPAQITADQNDYDPESPATNRSSHWRLDTDASRTVTGIANGLDGRYLIITNVGSNDLVLADENASSAAANRISSPTQANITLAPEDTVILIYDSTSSRWRVLSITT